MRFPKDKTASIQNAIYDREELLTKPEEMLDEGQSLHMSRLCGKIREGTFP
jgi:hypothetical protein